MSDLIDRQAAIDAIKREQAYYAPEDGAEIFYEYNHAIKALKNLPSAQPKRKKGKWIMHHDGILWRREWGSCSHCGNTLDFAGLNAGRGNANFCPNCGARMK